MRQKKKIIFLLINMLLLIGLEPSFFASQVLAEESGQENGGVGLGNMGIAQGRKHKIEGVNYYKQSEKVI